MVVWVAVREASMVWMPMLALAGQISVSGDDNCNSFL
jgi:hypothetical protein